jgi:hypothetical protein
VVGDSSGPARPELEVRHGLQLADNPSVRAGSHEHDVVHNDMLIVNELSSIRNL